MSVLRRAPKLDYKPPVNNAIPIPGTNLTQRLHVPHTNEGYQLHLFEETPCIRPASFDMDGGHMFELPIPYVYWITLGLGEHYPTIAMGMSCERINHTSQPSLAQLPLPNIYSFGPCMTATGLLTIADIVTEFWDAWFNTDSFDQVLTSNLAEYAGVYSNRDGDYIDDEDFEQIQKDILTAMSYWEMLNPTELNNLDAPTSALVGASQRLPIALPACELEP